jgi:hypothetical protein
VAWQVQELRLFYGGPAALNGFFEQWGITAMAKPEFPVFQYFRGVLWLLCLIPLFMGFTGKRAELIVLSALALCPAAHCAVGLRQSVDAGGRQFRALLGSRHLHRDFRGALRVVCAGTNWGVTEIELHRSALPMCGLPAINHSAVRRRES